MLGLNLVNLHDPCTDNWIVVYFLNYLGQFDLYNFEMELTLIASNFSVWCW